MLHTHGRGRGRVPRLASEERSGPVDPSRVIQVRMPVGPSVGPHPRAGLPSGALASIDGQPLGALPLGLCRTGPHPCHLTGTRG